VPEGNRSEALKKGSVALVAGLVAMVGIANGAQPPDVVDSDKWKHRDGKTDASNLTIRQQHRRWYLSALRQHDRHLNTASGYNALGGNTEGNANTASVPMRLQHDGSNNVIR
jgi:hypothetical protein